MPSKEEIEQAKKEILASITDPLHGTMYCQEDVKNASEILLKHINELENKAEQLEAEKKKVEATLEDYQERKRYYDDEKIEHDEEYYRIEGKIDILQEIMKGE